MGVLTDGRRWEAVQRADRDSNIRVARRQVVREAEQDLVRTDITGSRCSEHLNGFDQPFIVTNRRHPVGDPTGWPGDPDPLADD